MTAPIVSKPRTTKRTDAPAVLYLLLAVLGLLAFTYAVRLSVDTYRDARTFTVAVRPPFRLAGYPPRIEKVDTTLPAEVQEGDQVVSIDGQPIQGANSFGKALHHHSPGEKLVVEEIRRGIRRRVEVQLESDTHGPSRLGFLLIVIGLGFFVPWSSLLLGFSVAFVRIKDPLAWIVLAMLLSFSHLVSADLSEWGEWIRVPAEIFHNGLFLIWPICFLLFCVYFPTPPTLRERQRWIMRAGLVLYFLPVIFLIVLRVGSAEDLRSVSGFEGFANAVLQPFALLTFGMIAAGIFLLGRKARREARPDARRRLRLLAFGVLVSIAPILGILLYAYLSHHALDLVPPAVLLAALLAVILFPITLAYVIVIGRAMDVRLVIRQGLQYAFAKKGIIVVRTFVLLLFTVIGLETERRFRGQFTILIPAAAGMVGAVLLINLSARRLGTWVDRKFFRDAFNAETVLTELSEQVRTIRETPLLVETVCRQIADTLHVDKLTVLLDRDGTFCPFYSRGFDEKPQVEFPESSSLVSYLRQAREAQRVYFDDEDSWIYRTPGVDDTQRERLASLESELLLPLSAGPSLLGFISAGPKRSEEPYSKSDIRILTSVAAQTGLALENAQLTSAIAAEMAQRERLAREVEIAREVQERLFPQRLPPVQGIDYAGMCRTALGVGGDYYDFILLPNDRFGFAVGDVAGKGISAALLMASLQASLRAETARPVENLTSLIANLNGRVYEASSTNRYATFFFARYATSNRLLEYVNAGHNPPILIQRTLADWTVQQLETGGTVIGLLPAATYEQGSIQMRCGDYLVAFTDGISEAMNAADEEWGEDRLTETLLACARANLSATETMSRILSSADTFVAGAKQHDDMTLIVIRVLE